MTSALFERMDAVSIPDMGMPDRVAMGTVWCRSVVSPHKYWIVVYGFKASYPVLVDASMLRSLKYKRDIELPAWAK